MTFDEILKHLNGKGISIDAAALTTYLQSIGMSADQVQPSLLKSIEADLQKAIAPATPSTAITKRKGGKMTKVKQQESIAPHATTVNTRAVESNAAALTTSQQVISGIGAGLIGQDQAALMQVAQLNAALVASAPQRLDAATQALLAQMGVADPTDSILQQHAASCNSMVRSIALAINDSNVALGISGMGFDVEVEE